jgi:pyruvate formate-lyase activating enzyme-like uncharacterized protein
MVLVTAMLAASKIAGRDKMIIGNLAEYGDQAQSLRWIDPTRSFEAEGERARILGTVKLPVTLAFKQTKPHFGQLSPGCRICGQGDWSCLFINGRCNCRCFYCPTAQDDIGVPTTNRVPFATPDEYAAYVDRFAFAGVSISGGEPLLTYERSVAYIQAVRRKMGDGLHIWLYTNGKLATAERLAGLKSAGLDEIRFDISAVDYDLAKVRLASDYIDCVTVEIPAIPEDAERVAELLPALADAGVQHLNLHQLRLTPHNHTHLSQRQYTFLHGESVTVLESELAALALLQAACRQSRTPAVNYCSYVYKRRYQKAAARRHNALGIIKGFETLTENGFIRTLSLVGEPDAIGRQAEGLARQGQAAQLWAINGKQDRLQFHPDLWSQIDLSAGRLAINYAEAILTSHISYRYAFKEIPLTNTKKVFVEKRPLRLDFFLAPDRQDWYHNVVLHGDTFEATMELEPPAEILDFEFIQPGLQDYF